MAPLPERSETISASRARTAFLLAGGAIAALSGLLFSRSVIEGLHTVEYSDEWEHFVVAQMLLNGDRLYKDVFSHHGPFPYMLAHLYASAINHDDFSYIRLAQAILGIVSCLALASSPVFRTMSSRLWSGAIYLLLLSPVWNVEGFALLNYYSISGPLFVIVVTQLVVPMLLRVRPTKGGLFSSGAAAALACFCAYSNGPAIILFSLSSLIVPILSSDRRSIANYSKPFLLGSSVAALVVGIWLWKFGDLHGFFIYHFYFNQKIYSEFINYSFIDVLRNLSFSLEPEGIIHSFSLVLFVGWLFILAVLRKDATSRSNAAPYFLAVILIAIGVLFTDPRGYTTALGGCGFVIVNISLFTVATTLLLQTGMVAFPVSPRRLFNVIALVVGVALLAIPVGMYATCWIGVRQKDMSRYVSTMRMERTAIYEFIRSITKQEGDLLQINGSPIIYIKAGRLPASGHFFYTPWQAAYNRAPKRGYKINICTDIKTQNPAVIYFLNWRAYDRWSLDEYEPCVLSLISAGYAPLKFDSPWYIRNDLWRAATSTAPTDTGIQLEPWFRMLYGLNNTTPIMKLSAPLSPSSPISIMMAPNHEERQLPLKRIGILLGTHGMQNSGRGKLHLNGSGETKFFQQFELSELDDNKYQYFDLDPQRYTTGAILSATGGGISTWESHLGTPYTCVIYEYADGTRGFTPACPLL